MLSQGQAKEFIKRIFMRRSHVDNKAVPVVGGGARLQTTSTSAAQSPKAHNVIFNVNMVLGWIKNPEGGDIGSAAQTLRLT